MGGGKERADNVSAAEVEVREVPRRQFLRGIGLSKSPPLFIGRTRRSYPTL